MDNSGRIPTILIVEDIDWIRSAMRKAIARQEYRVAEATNDAEAFAFAELQPIDLILTEEELPTFNDLMAVLHQHPTLSSVPVVIINPDEEHGARLGDAYLLADYADISSFLAVLNR
jgi:response regulator RpfG family c-di-GMP phosphodiesterase